MRYFGDCYTEDQGKERYRVLAQSLHPDRGGSNEAFAAMRQEYEEWKIVLKHRAALTTPPQKAQERVVVVHHVQPPPRPAVTLQDLLQAAEMVAAGIAVGRTIAKQIDEWRKMFPDDDETEQPDADERRAG